MTTSIKSEALYGELQVNGVSAVPFNAGGVTDKILPLTASVAGNALTITLNPTVLDFRDPTFSSGVVTTRVINSPISVVVSSGSTLGTQNSTAARLAVLAVDNAGTVALAVMNLDGATSLREIGLITTLAEGGAGGADTTAQAYSTSVLTSLTYRIVGFIDITQATAGTWASAPTRVQGAGGIALAQVFMNAPGNSPLYACRAWVNFNGTGTVAINASGNISSITDNGVGDYTVNFTVSLPDANYAVTAAAQRGATNNDVQVAINNTGGLTTSSARILTGASAVAVDCAIVSVAFFR